MDYRDDSPREDGIGNITLVFYYGGSRSPKVEVLDDTEGSQNPAGQSQSTLIMDVAAVHLVI